MPKAKPEVLELANIPEEEKNKLHPPGTLLRVRPGIIYKLTEKGWELIQT